MPRSASLGIAGRGWYAVTAATSLSAIVIEMILAGIGDPRFGSSAARVANVFTYFTIASNVLVGIVGTLIALGRMRCHALFVAALVGISITGAVFHALLARLIPQLSGAPALANALLHTAVPLMMIAGWLVTGPRGAFTRRSVLWSLIYPLGWLGATLIRGALAGYYPYPFLDVAALGYARMLANVAMIAALYVALAASLGVVDRGLAHRTPGHHVARS